MADPKLTDALTLEELAESKRITDEIQRIDRLAGCTPGTLNHLEACFQEQGIRWTPAATVLWGRYGAARPRTVTGWLEGYLVGRVVERPLTAAAAIAKVPEPSHPVGPFDPTTATTATTSRQAAELAKAWAEGRRSHWNTILSMEASPEMRGQSIALCAQADAQEVVKWSALATALAATEAHQIP